MTFFCAICDVALSHLNNSNEHILPNAIGGQKKIKNFICNDCNNLTGMNWDAELANQLNPLCLFFGITRDRGTTPSQIFKTDKGTLIKKHIDGSFGLAKPTYNEIKTEKGTKINIQTDSIKEFKKMLSGVKRKYPIIDIEDVMKNASFKEVYPNETVMFELSIGGLMGGRSIVKSALALAVNSGENPKNCSQALNYLKNKNSEAPFGYYYEHDLVVNRPNNFVFHCVAVQGNKEKKLLLGYVELFSIYRMVICLSDIYEGHDFFHSYAINPVLGQEINLEVKLDLSREEIKDTYNYGKIPNGSMELAFQQAIPLGLKRSSELARNRAVENAIDYAFKNCGAKEGEYLTQEQHEKLTSLIMEKMDPYLENLALQMRKH